MTDYIKREETQKEIVEWASIEKNLIEEIKNRRDFWLSKASKYDEIKDEMNTDICDGKAVELEIVMKMIQEQPKADEWIPCSERLPEEDGIYIVDDRVFNSPWIHTAGFMVSSKAWCENHGVYYDDKYGRYEDGRVIAWQPLPEPWRGEEK